MHKHKQDKELHTIEELCGRLGVGSSSLSEIETSLNNILNSETACNVIFWVTTTVHIAGYVEGSGQGHASTHSLSFPFTMKEFNSLVRDAEASGCEVLDRLETGEVDD